VALRTSSVRLGELVPVTKKDRGESELVRGEVSGDPGPTTVVRGEGRGELFFLLVVPLSGRSVEGRSDDIVWLIDAKNAGPTVRALSEKTRVARVSFEDTFKEVRPGKAE